MNGRPTEKRSVDRRNVLARVSTFSVVAAVALSVVGVLIVTPRPTMPHVIPLPTIDGALQTSTEGELRRRAERVHQAGLPKEARIVGEEFRRLGAKLSRNAPIFPAEWNELRSDVDALLQSHQEEQLLNLRALQSELFLQAVRRFERTNRPDDDLLELGGQFAEIATNSWLDEDGRLLFDDDELRLFFRIHWGKLLGLLGTPGFSLSLAELRRYYASNLRHPSTPTGAADPVAQALARLSLARALGEVDPEYPVLLAEGVFLLQAQQPARAALSLRAFLEKSTDGPWVHAARNHLRLAVLSSDDSGVVPLDR